MSLVIKLIKNDMQPTRWEKIILIDNEGKKGRETKRETVTKCDIGWAHFVHFKIPLAPSDFPFLHA